jgi:CHAT domain-containing protein
MARAPHTVVLAACESGRSVVCAGDELLGLGAMFLARGSSQLVASPLPVPDAETAPLMTALHRDVAAGRPVAEALARAQHAVRGNGGGTSDATDVAAGSFVCVGSGFGRAPLLRPPSRPEQVPTAVR